jgi:N-acetylneuraminate synthase
MATTSAMPVTLEPARPVEADAALVMAWRNDPVTLAVSYHHEPKQWAGFWPEFRDRYFPADAPGPMFALEGGRRVGFLRFAAAPDPDGARRCIDLSINVAPEARGRGIGRAVLAAAEAHLRALGAEAIYAEVRVDNAASQRAFEAAGYRRLGETVKPIPDTGEAAAIVRYLRALA